MESRNLIPDDQHEGPEAATTATLLGGLGRLHGYLAMAEAFIFLHLPPAFLHCFFVPASEISDP